MKKMAIIVVIAILMFLISLLIKVMPVEGAGPFYPKPPPLLVFVYSPENKIYNTNSIMLNVSIGIWAPGRWPGELGEITYSLDGQEDKIMILLYEGAYYDSPESMIRTHYSGSTSLNSFSDGNHTITIHGILKIENYTLSDYKIVNFAVDAPPRVSILVAENEIFQTSDLALDFTVDKAPSNLTYSLDGKSNVTITGNTALTGLANGYHNLTVYATDEIGTTGASETLFFEVEAPFPIVLVASSIIIIIIVIAILLIYFKKRKC